MEMLFYLKGNYKVFKKCVRCENGFRTKPSSRKQFCTFECYNLYKRELNTYICEYCGESYYRTKKKEESTKRSFCSHACHGKFQTGKNNHMWKGGKVEKECVICDKIFIVSLKRSKEKNKGIVCSNKCVAALSAMRAKEIRYCTVCNEEFVINKGMLNKYCSRECADLAHSFLMRGEGNTNYVDGNSHRRHPHEFNNKLKKVIRLRDNYTCQICGVIEEVDYYRALDVHHADYDKTNNEESNLISLCKKCHSRTNGNREYWKRRLSKLLNVK